MTVGESVRKAIDDFQNDELESAMLHASNAVDGTAKKAYPSIKRNRDRFTKLLRDNYEILGAMGAPGINLAETFIPMGDELDEDVAGIIYRVHRCTHGHGEELPQGFELISDVKESLQRTRIHIDLENGRVQLSDRIILGLLAVAVMAPVNKDQRVPDGYCLSLSQVFKINEWWGRSEEFNKIIKANLMPNVKLDFSEWKADKFRKGS